MARSHARASSADDAIEVIGVFGHRGLSEHSLKDASAFDVDFQARLVRAYDRNGYDRILIANGSSWPDSLPIAAYVSALTKRVGWMIAHRPGFIAPTMAARMLAVVDQVSRGRAAVHVITGGNDNELAADGDRLPKADRYRRSGEYVEVLRRMWASAEPFDHDGEFYSMRGAQAQVRPVNGASLPVYWGGLSPEAISGAARHADTYAFPIASLAQTGDLIDRVRAAAAAAGRRVGLCMSLRVIAADTEAAAWAKADKVLADFTANAAGLIRTSMATKGLKQARPHDHTERLLSQGPLVDKRLWTEITRVTQGTRAVTCLVGDYGQIVDALLDYYDLGVRSFLMSGFDMRRDPRDYGRSLIPALRSAVAERVKSYKDAGHAAG